MADTLLFRGGSTADVNNAATTVNDREIVIDTETNQIVLGSGKDRTVMTEGATGKVGIGTSSPSSYFYQANNLVVANTPGNAGASFVSSTTGNASIAFADGTSGADAYRGLIAYYHSDNSMRLHTDALERVRINAAGRIGINTTAPGELVEVKTGEDRSLLIRGNRTSLPVELFACNPASGYRLRDFAITGNTLQFNVGANTGTSSTERMRITADGKLLVGTSTWYTVPDGYYGQAWTQGQQIKVTDTGSAYGGLAVVSASSTVNARTADIALNRQNGSTDYALLPNNAPIGTVTFNGADGSKFVRAASIRGEVDGTSGTNDMPGRLLFSTSANGSVIPTERMRIDSGGNVGIGTSGGATGFGNVLRQKPAGGAAGYFAEGANSDTWLGLYSGTGAGDSAALFYPSTGSFRIGSTTATGTTGFSEKLRITADGNVGIGTTAPGSSLEVVGDYSAGATGYGTLNITSNNTGNVGADGRASLGFSAPFAPGGTRILYGLIEGRKDPTGGQGNTKGFLSFSTSPQSSTGPVERMRVDSNGRLLIGTSTSTSVAGSAATVQIDGVGSNPHGLQLTRSDAPILTFGKTNSASGSSLGAILFAGHDTNDINSIGARITGEIDGTIGVDDMPGRLVFSTTADGASSPTERMRIKSSGIVNISNAPVYADNTAALAGGLVAGDIYRKSDGTLMITF